MRLIKQKEKLNKNLKLYQVLLGATYKNNIGRVFSIKE